MSTLSAAALLVVVMDPLGNIPMFLAALRDVDESRRRYIVLRELAIALAVLILFLVGGRHVLEIFHISEPSLSIAGGIILFLIALRMIFRGEEVQHAQPEPLAALVQPAHPRPTVTRELERKPPPLHRCVMCQTYPPRR